MAQISGQKSSKNRKKLTQIQSKNQQKHNKIKILGSGNITNKLDIEADFSSKSAKDKIEKIGGKLLIKKS